MTQEGWSYWLSQYGVWAVLLGTFLEGESILIGGAIAARQGYLNINQVLLAALIGSFTGDQLWFLMGRIYGRRFLLQRPHWRRRVARVHKLLQRYHTSFILGFRFLYGLRSVAPFVLGTSEVGFKRFIPLNFMGALLWSLTVGGLGYALGVVSLSHLLSGPDGTVPPFVCLTIAVCGGALLFLLWRRVRQGAASTEDPKSTDDACQ